MSVNRKNSNVKTFLDEIGRKSKRMAKLFCDYVFGELPVLPKHPPKVNRVYFMDKLSRSVGSMVFNLGLDGCGNLDFTMKMNEAMFDIIYNDLKLTDEDLNQFLFNTGATTFSISQKEFEFDGKSIPFGFIRMSGSKFQKKNGFRKTFHQFFWFEDNELRLSEAHVIKTCAERGM